ncbi:MAG: hydroxymethylglutaryl-CoA lyase [Pseudomonadales bacterium]
MDAVQIIEVAPRDGFQSVQSQIPLTQKLSVIAALVDAGLQQIEVGAFVSPKALPQMSDISALLAELEREQTLDGVQSMVLVPNLKGVQRALEHGCKTLNFVFSASEAHNLNNVAKTVQQSLDDLTGIAKALQTSLDVELRVSIATCFDCPFDGDVDPQWVLEVLQRTLSIAPNAKVALCDTTGRAHPFAVASLFTKAQQYLAAEQLIFHGHDTYGFAIANIAAAYQSGIRAFDSAVAGFGGCPFAPGASGNVATEDVVYFFHKAGIETSVDADKLKAAIELAQQIDGAQLSGHLRHLMR